MTKEVKPFEIIDENDMEVPETSTLTVQWPDFVYPWSFILTNLSNVEEPQINTYDQQEQGNLKCSALNLGLYIVHSQELNC